MDTERTWNSGPKKGFADLFSEAFRLLAKNPVLFIPQAAALAAFLFVTVLLAVLYFGSIAAAVERMGDVYNHIVYGDPAATAIEFLFYSFNIFAAWLVFAAAAKVFHSAGWNNMLAAAASGAGAGIGDYFSGIPEFIGATTRGILVIASLKAACLLVFGIAWAVFTLIWSRTPEAVALCFIVVSPLLIVAWLTVDHYSSLWRPALFIDRVPAVEALLRSARLVRSERAQIVTFILLRPFTVLLAVSIFVILAMGGGALFREIERAARIPAGEAFLSIAAALLCILGYALSALFSLLPFVFYREMTLPAARREEPGDDETWFSELGGRWELLPGGDGI